MAKPPSTLPKPILGRVISSQTNQSNTYFKIEEIDENANQNWKLKYDKVLSMLYELSRGITNRDVYSTAVAEKSGYDEKTTM